MNEKGQTMIYLDNGATTKLCERALEAMLPYLRESYGNSFGVYQLGRAGMQAVEKARGRIARLIGAGPREIYFTSGGTESDNWALRLPALLAIRDGGIGEPGHIITSAIEHPAVLNTLNTLADAGWRITRIPPDRAGRIDPAAVQAAVRPDTKLISIMTANNEIGTIEPIREIGEIAAAHHILFHTDAVQAVGHIPLDMKDLQVDLLSASGHKFGGPKGTGFLYVRQGTDLRPLLTGGGQERQMRAGTHNVPGIVGMGEAAEECGEELERRIRREETLRNDFLLHVRKAIPDVKLNGPDPEEEQGGESIPAGCSGIGAGAGSTSQRPARLPGNVNFTIPGVSSEALLFRLDQEGICASAGSACAAGAMEPSHVLKAIGRTREEAFQSVRFTLSYRNTEEEMDRTVETLERIVRAIRAAADDRNGAE